MSQEPKIVGIGQFEETTFEIIQVERGGEKKYFYRLIVDDKITYTDAALYDVQEDCLDAVLAKVIPDSADETGEGPGPEDFRVLNQMLIWTPENGAITCLMDALEWHNRLYEAMPNLTASKVKSTANFRDILGILEKTVGSMSELYANTVLMRDIMLKQYEMCESTSDRDLDALASFIEHFLGSGS